MLAQFHKSTVSVRYLLLNRFLFVLSIILDKYRQCEHELHSWISINSLSSNVEVENQQIFLSLDIHWTYKFDYNPFMCIEEVAQLLNEKKNRFLPAKVSYRNLSTQNEPWSSSILHE